MPSTRPEKPRNEREVRLAATSVMGKPCKNFGISAVSSFSLTPANITIATKEAYARTEGVYKTLKEGVALGYIEYGNTEHGAVCCYKRKIYAERLIKRRNIFFSRLSQ